MGVIAREWSNQKSKVKRKGAKGKKGRKDKEKTFTEKLSKQDENKVRFQVFEGFSHFSLSFSFASSSLPFFAPLR